jgi:hypothetical protein
MHENDFIFSNLILTPESELPHLNDEQGLYLYE